MVKFMKRGRVVIVTQGRFAGSKGVILETKEPSKKHKFHHCVVAGISKAPRRVNKKMNKTQIREKSRMNTFVKVINQIHVMPTRYKLDIKMGDIPVKSLNPKDGKRKKLRQDVRRKFRRMYFKNSKPSVRWFFKKLYF
mmetsp:Transcript_11727/g.10480  ORF Transcript_11727/g.10480 Transcript_11727/m.10480 type:complete len:138 (+) Transcript_11727:110-523(+)